MGFEVLETFGNFSHVKFGELSNLIFKELDSIVYFRKDFNQECLKGYSRFSVAPRKIMKKIIDKIKNLKQ